MSKVKAVHYWDRDGTFWQTMCGRNNWRMSNKLYKSLVIATDPSKVTCKQCLAAMAGQVVATLVGGE